VGVRGWKKTSRFVALKRGGYTEKRKREIEMMLGWMEKPQGPSFLWLN
jgi:hypothetical protein